MAIWAYIAFHDTGVSGGQAEPDVSEAVRDLLTTVDGLRRFYGSVTCWQVMKESASTLAERMLAEAPATIQHGQTWTATVGDVEARLYPRHGGPISQNAHHGQSAHHGPERHSEAAPRHPARSRLPPDRPRS